MKIFEKTFWGALAGVGIGNIMNLAFSLPYKVYSAGVPSYLEQFSSDFKGIFLEYLIFAVLGVIQINAGNIMKNENRSLLTNSIIHFCIIVLPLFCAAFFLHWATNYVMLICIAISIIAIYAIIWIVFYLKIRKDITKINEKIKLNN